MATRMTIKRNAKANNVDLCDVFENYLSEKDARNLSPATIFSYRESFKKFQCFVGEETPADEMSIDVIYKWIAAMKADRKPTAYNYRDY